MPTSSLLLHKAPDCTTSASPATFAEIDHDVSGAWLPHLLANIPAPPPPPPITFTAQQISPVPPASFCQPLPEGQQPRVTFLQALHPSFASDIPGALHITNS